VDPQWQGKGVGSLLLEQVQRSFKRSGTLKCLSRNENALRFYQHYGWKLEAQGADLDKGTPTVIARPESEFTDIYRQLAGRVAAQMYWQGEVRCRR
jgi:GNAT superfamily N-acetyltransferase